MNTMAKGAQSLAKTKGLLLNYLSITFATGSQKVLCSYSADDIKRMQETAAKYNAKGVFQKLQYDGFLLRNNI
jgi:hypothetical protein